MDGFTVGGMAKGSGMIHPLLATMLAVVTTDYPLEPGEAIDFLRPAVDRSFNSISVDGECSTNDAVCLLANGASGIERTPASDMAFALALGRVCDELAEQIVADGEGATVLAEIEVTGAVDAGQARAIAARIATSPLVKTALFGHDANWGRVLAAAGSAPHNGGFASVRRAASGSPTTARWCSTGRAAGRRARRLERRPAGSSSTSVSGEGSASYLTSDLSYDYVRINADYRDMSPIVVKLGGAVAAEAGASCSVWRPSTTSASFTAPDRRSRPSWSGRPRGPLRRGTARDECRRAHCRSRTRSPP